MSLCFGYSLTFICLICIAGSFVVAIVEKWVVQFQTITLPFYPCTIYLTLMLYYIISLGCYLGQSHCFDFGNLGSHFYNHRKCFIWWLDDCILLYLYAILSSCNFRCHSIPSMCCDYLLDLAIYLVNYCYLANSCIWLEFSRGWSENCRYCWSYCGLDLVFGSDLLSRYLCSRG